MAAPAPRPAEQGEGILNHKLYFCPRLKAWGQKRLAILCSCCDCYMVHCCNCDMREADKIADLGFTGHQAETIWQAALANREATNTTCHHFRLVFVSGYTITCDGEDSVTGLGFAFGKKEEHQGSLIVDEEIDPFKVPMIAQRAQILAATEGLLALSCWEASHEKKARNVVKGRGSEVANKAWVIGTSSKYLVKAMTEDLPAWKQRNQRKGSEPENLDLLETLSSAIAAEESRQRVSIGFWQVQKSLNREAPELARKAVKSNCTPDQLAAMEKKLQAEKEVAKAGAGSNQAKDAAAAKTLFEKENPDSSLEKQGPDQDTTGKAKGKGKVKTSKVEETGPDVTNLMAKHLHMI